MSAARHEADTNLRLDVLEVLINDALNRLVLHRFGHELAQWNSLQGGLDFGFAK